MLHILENDIYYHFYFLTYVYVRIQCLTFVRNYNVLNMHLQGQTTDSNSQLDVLKHREMNNLCLHTYWPSATQYFKQIIPTPRQAQRNLVSPHSFAAICHKNLNVYKIAQLCGQFPEICLLDVKVMMQIQCSQRKFLLYTRTETRHI